MRRTLILLALLLLALTDATGQTPTQALSYQDLIDNVTAGNFTWTAGVPAGWGGNVQIANRHDFASNINTNGSCAGASSNYIMAFGDMMSCALNTSQHSPLLTANSFCCPSFTGWTAGVTGSPNCSDYSTFAASTILGGVDDAYSAYAQSGVACTTPYTTTVNMQQTINVGGTPTAQTYSLYYYFIPATAGINTCTFGLGALSNLVMTDNGTTIVSVSSPTQGAWVHLSGSTTVLTAGSQVIKITLTLAPAIGTSGFMCRTTNIVAQPVAIDNVSLKATW